MNNIEFFSEKVLEKVLEKTSEKTPEKTLENEVNELMELIDQVPINKLLGHTFYKLITTNKLTKTEASATEIRSLNLIGENKYEIKDRNTRFVKIGRAHV